MNHPIRVVIADDHLLVRKGLRLMLEEMGEDIRLAGEAADGAAALRLAGEVQPDVVLMDLRMPGMDGLEAIEHIRAEFPQVAVLILTIYNEDELMIRGLRAGDDGSFALPDSPTPGSAHPASGARSTGADGARTGSAGGSRLRRPEQGDSRTARYYPSDSRSPFDQHLYQTGGGFANVSSRSRSRTRISEAAAEKA